MSQQLVSRNADLIRLRNEGYNLEVRAGRLLVHDVPYVASDRTVRRGTIVSELTLAGDKTARPDTHVVDFVGEYPCRQDGSPIEEIRNSTADRQLAEGLVVNHMFSNKPPGGYLNYYHKITSYVGIIAAPAQSIDPSATPMTFAVVEPEEEDSVFNYADTFSSRAEIDRISDKLKGHRIGIIGLGGTGSYVLDFVAKTPVAEIHLFDADLFLGHNAFRAPGAPGMEELRKQPPKVEYFAGIYGRMHRHVSAHRMYVDGNNADSLPDLDFVFVCVDKGSARRTTVEQLEKLGLTFVDTGMGVQEADSSLGGILRTTTSVEGQRELSRDSMDFSDRDGDDDYDRDIQIVELNALNAAFAVIKWKKLCGFYRDCRHEYNSLYTVGANTLVNEDAAT